MLLSKPIQIHGHCALAAHRQPGEAANRAIEDDTNLGVRHERAQREHRNDASPLEGGSSEILILRRQLGRLDKRLSGAARLLRVENVRLEAPVTAETLPSTLLKFDVVNGGSTPLTDFILEISILEKPALDEVSGKALVRPFKIRGNIVLQAGYTVNYEMLLRNLSSDCGCIATVEVVSVQSLPESGS